MQNWDLFIVSPVIILFSFVCLYLLYRKQNMDKKLFWFYIQTILVWIACFISIEKFNNTTSIVFQNSPPAVVITLLFFGSTLFFAIFLKPLATFLSTKLKSRNILIIFGMLTILISLLLNLIPVSESWWFKIILVLVAIFISLSLSTQTLYFLYLNEQKYNKFFPLKTSFAIGFLIVLSSFISKWVFSINNLIETDTFYLLVVLAAVCLVLAVFINFKKMSENKDKVGEFRLNLKEEFAQYSKKYVIKISILTFLLGFIFAMMQSPLVKMYVVSSAIEANYATNWLVSLDRKFDAIFIFAQFVFGYLVYKKLMLKLGIKNIIIGLSFITSVVIFANTFIANLWFILLSNFIFGACYFALFYMWFGFAIMWNYRATKIPVTGIVASASIAGQFLVSLTLNIFLVIKLGALKYSNIEQLILETDIEKIKEFTNQLREIIKIISACVFFISCVYLVLSVWWVDQIIAEYKNYSEINQKVIDIEKKVIEKKISARIIID